MMVRQNISQCLTRNIRHHRRHPSQAYQVHRMQRLRHLHRQFQTANHLVSAFPNWKFLLILLHTILVL